MNSPGDKRRRSSKPVEIVRRLERAYHREMLASKPGSSRAIRFANAASVAEVIRTALKYPYMVSGLIRVMKGKR